MCRAVMGGSDDSNAVVLSGVIEGGPFFRFKDGKARCEFMLRVRNKWGTSNLFRIQAQGADAYNALLMVQYGRPATINGRLKNTFSNKGGVLIVATDMGVTAWNGYPTPETIRQRAESLELAILSRDKPAFEQGAADPDSEDEPDTEPEPATEPFDEDLPETEDAPESDDDA